MIKEDDLFIDTLDSTQYKTIKISNQICLAENLRFKTADGCWAFENDERNVSKYGYLYDWETAFKVCPAGWHLPSDEEWKILIRNLEGDGVAGGKMKATHLWESLNRDATNSIGSSVLPLGSNGPYGFGNFGQRSYFWSSTMESDKYEWFIYLVFADGNCYRRITDRESCFSIRCLKKM